MSENKISEMPIKANNGGKTILLKENIEMEIVKKINYPDRVSHFDIHRDEIERLHNEGKKLKDIHRIVSEKMHHKLTYAGFWKWFKNSRL